MTGELLKTQPKVAYRKIDALNQSSVALYATSPLKFYNEYILGKGKEDDASFALGIGTLADFYILECKGDDEIFQQRFDEQFVLNKQDRGTKQVFVLADELFGVAKKNLDENGVVNGNITVMFQEAFANVQSMKNAQGKPYYGGKDWKKALVDFNDNGREYYDLLLANIGKTVVDDKILHIVKRIKDQLFNDENLNWLFMENDGYEAFNKLPIEFSYKGWKCKAEIDRLFIDHEARKILPKDLKCTYLNEDFAIGYLKDKYYIQNGWYWLAVKEWAVDNDMEDYEVLPMDFIVCDTTANKRRPLLYQTSTEHIKEALSGFTHKGRKYKGINQLLDEITWANDNGIWNITAENFNNKSIVKLPKFDGV